MAKEPGEVAFYAAGWVTPWDHLDDQTRAQWSAIEAACRASALEEAAKVAETAWLTCPYGEIADADAMCALSEHTEAAIRALIPTRPADGGEAG